MSAHVPYIPPERSLPELTVKGVILGLFLAVILGAANTYLGLRVGLTVSASIPAAVISMGLLRLFRKHNILENNAVQTAASAGESLAAGVLFTVPALILLDYWTEIDYVTTTLVALTGGVLGVLFTVPLRRALVVEADLTFPEGIATAEVLKTGERDADGKTSEAGKAGLIALLVGGLVGIAYKFMQSGMKLWADTALWAQRVKDQGVVAFGSDLSPALLGVGYIIGLRIASLVFFGGIIGWLVAIPIYSILSPDTIVATPDGDSDWMALFTGGSDSSEGAGDVAGLIWSTQIRYMGVGAMLVGGLWSLIKLRKPLAQAVTGIGKARGPDVNVKRTEQDLGIGPTFLGVLLMVVPLFGLYWYATDRVEVALLMAILMVVTGFLFSAVGAYMAGIVGSSNNPISGVTILTVLAAAFTLKALGIESDVGPGATILVAAVIASAGAIGSDNMQDLKAGRLLGATPRKQQIMQVLGVSAAAFAIAPVLQVLHEAYTFGSTDLPAPQAGLMAAVSDFVFNGGLPTTMVAIGAAIAVLLLIMDEVLQARGSSLRTPVMPVAVGIYLPVGLSAPIFLGGLVAWFAERRYDRVKQSDLKEDGMRNGILMASGLIAGEALIGIALAGILVAGAGDAIAVGSHLTWPGLVMFGYVSVLLYFIARRTGILAGRA